MVLCKCVSITNKMIGKLLFCVLINYVCWIGAQEGQPCDDVYLCPKGYSCHPAQGICYEDVESTDRLHIWLGSPPENCNFSSHHCAIFDMDYDRSHINGGGDWCYTGEKVRCLYKTITPSPEPTPANQIVVVAYNIFERPWFITTDGQRERTCRIPRILTEKWPDIDVLAFQEGFRDGCWSDQLSMRDLLKAHGFEYQTKTIRHSLKVENGGIFIASKWPILEEDSTVFKISDPTSADLWVAKGVSYAKLKKTVNEEEHIYHVMSTHFQAGGPDSIKLAQAQQWSEFVQSKAISPDEAVIFAGDFNMKNGSNLLSYAMRILGARMPDELIGNYTGTSDPNINQILYEKNPVNFTRPVKWIDHVLYSANHLKPVSSHNEILVPRDPQKFSVCWCNECILYQLGYRWPETWDCSETDGVYKRRIVNFNDLSDHFPIVGSFVF